MIKSDNITLRPLNRDDYKNTLQWRNDLELSGLAMSHPFPVTEELELEWYDNILKDKSNKTIYFGIDNNDSNMIGLVYLSDIDWLHRTCRFHIIIGDRNSQGKGYGKEVLNLIKYYVFDILNFRKITLHVTESNAIAIKLYKSYGFIVEGKLERHHYFNGKYEAVFIMSLFKEKIL